MPLVCCIKNCRMKYTRGGPSFHCFPKNTELLVKWRETIGEENIQLQKVPKICRNHFEEKFIRYLESGYVVLKEDAVPTIFESPKERKSILKINEDSPPRKRKHFSGDFTIEDMDSAESARKFFMQVKEEKKMRDKDFHKLIMRNQRLKKQISDINALLEECLGKKFLSTSDADSLKTEML